MATTQNIKFDGSLHCASFISGNKTEIQYGFSATDVEQIIQKILECLIAGAALVPQANDTLTAEWDNQTLVFYPQAAQRLAIQRNERSHLLSLILHKHYSQWATHFIPLKAEVDLKPRGATNALDIPLAYLEVHPPPPGAGLQAQATTEELPDITEALTRHDAFIILGDPGCGKTTTLQKITYDNALACLQQKGDLVPLFVNLSQQRTDSPFEFLQKIWFQKTGTNLADALTAGRVLLLLDGVNELPHDAALPQRLNDWRIFTEEYCGANKLVFTGREIDYGGHLNLPRVLVKLLDPERISNYLIRNQAEGLLQALEDASVEARRRMQDLVENPLYLSMLVHYYRENRSSLDNRGELFRWFANALIAREFTYHPENNPKNFVVEVWSSALAQFAFSAQEKKLGTILPIEIAQNLTPKMIKHQGKSYPIASEELFLFARGAKVLDPNLKTDIRFQHQMLHEYFAGLELLRRFEAGEDLSHLWVAPRLAKEMPPAEVGLWDPLPEPPSTGWEVTTILACGLAAAPSRLIEAVLKCNPNLAGRCLVESGADLQTLEAVRHTVSQNLLADLYNPEMHLRTRLQESSTLGWIGDPRFEPQEINGVRVIIPKMVMVPEGRYRIGSRDDPEAYPDEEPASEINLQGFYIGKWPVTNAEYACFITAGGYKNANYWQTQMAQRWLGGEEVTGGALSTFTEARKTLLSIPNWQEQVKDTWTPAVIERWEYFCTLSEEQAIEA